MTMNRLRLITPPATLPVTLEEARLYAHIDATDDDLLLQGSIEAAVNALDGRHGFLGRALEAQTWELVLDCFPVSEIVLPFGPVASVTSVKYDDTDGTEQTVAAESYVLDNVSQFEGRVIPVSGFAWPATMAKVGAARVRFVAGTGTPAQVHQCILEMVACAYDARGQGNKMLTPGVVSDLAPYRRPVVLP